MRRVVAFSGAVLLAAAIGWAVGRSGHGRADPPPPDDSSERDVWPAWPLFLPPGFRAADVEAVRDRFGTSLSRLDFAGKTFWLVELPYGEGVPYTVVGLYAP